MKPKEEIILYDTICVFCRIGGPLCKQNNLVLAAIDGRCASGKTTLAAQLQQQFDGSVIHMDHFFLRPHQRTPQRYQEPGGNVDRERFLEEFSGRRSIED